MKCPHMFRSSFFSLEKKKPGIKLGIAPEEPIFAQNFEIIISHLIKVNNRNYSQIISLASCRLIITLMIGLAKKISTTVGCADNNNAACKSAGGGNTGLWKNSHKCTSHLGDQGS